MRSLTAILLSLVCGVSLTLPPGWCCAASTSMPCRPTETPAAAHSCCRHKPPADTPPACTPAPTGEQPGPCICAGQRLAAPGEQKTSLPDLDALAGELVRDATPQTAAGGARWTWSADPGPGDSPLHLLHCVWLC
jgi:hypothetical protein